MKPFSSLNQQIAQLKARRLTIEDESKAKEYLLENNYYNVINLYSKILQVENNQYREGATFDEIVELHILDSEIKSTLLKSLIQVEKHFKSIFAYYFSESYPNEYDYLKTESYMSNRTLNIHQTLAVISKKINKLNRNHQRSDAPNNSVGHHIQVHGSVPLWVIINELDLGTVRYMYRYSDDRVRNKVARKLSEHIFQNTGVRLQVNLEANVVDIFLQCINDLRNCCAHNNKLWDFRTSISIHYIEPIYSQYFSHRQHRTSCFAIYLSLQLALSRNEFITLNNALKKQFKTTSEKIHSVDFNTVLQKYGFPEDWHAIDSLPQIP